MTMDSPVLDSTTGSSSDNPLPSPDPVGEPIPVPAPPPLTNLDPSPAPLRISRRKRKQHDRFEDYISCGGGGVVAVALPHQALFVSPCGSNELNYTSLWLLPRPHANSCFLNGLLMFPCGLLWLLSVPYCIHLGRFKKQQSSGAVRLHGAKLCFLLLMILGTSCYLGNAIYQILAQDGTELIGVISSVVLLISMSLCAILTHLERQRGFSASPTTFIFFIVLLLATSFNLYSISADAAEKGKVESVFELTNTVIFCFINVVLLVLFCIPYQTSDPDEQDRCRLSRATFLSHVSFGWLTRLVFTAYSKDLADEDVFRLRREDEVRANFKTLNQKWLEAERECQRWNEEGSDSGLDTTDESHLLADPEPGVEIKSGGRQPHLFPVLCSVFGADVLFAWLLRFITDTITYADPILIKLLIGFTSDPSQPAWHGAAYVFAYCVVGVISSAANHQQGFRNSVIAMRIRSALTSAIFKKALRMSNEARSGSTVGEIVNHMTVDTNRVAGAIDYLWFTWSPLLRFTITIVLLWQELGVAVLAGLGLLFALIPVNGLLIRLIRLSNEKEMKWKDKRLKLLSEVLSGMKVMKLYAWEPSYRDKVGKLRDTELMFRKRCAYLVSGIGIICSLVPSLMMVVCIITYVFIGDHYSLTAAQAFVSLSLFNMLTFPLTLLPGGTVGLIMAFVSIKRLNKFLNAPDIKPDVRERRPASEEGPAVSIENGFFGYSSTNEPLLTNINMEVEKGKIIAVVGHVGSGKSTLVSAILGELHKFNGSVVTRGSITYVPQQAWIQHMSVRDNIIFGLDYEECWYNEVLDCCALRPDLAQLQAGDKTEIGERGINLSGGQKQRVSLARAVYHRSDIYILDDPLSAVDAHVGRHLFEGVIGHDGVLKGSTRILVTHGLQWLPYVDAIVVLEEGKITEFGTYGELISNPDGLLPKLLSERQEEEEEEYDETAVCNIDVDVEYEPHSLNSSHTNMLGRLSRQMSVQLSRQNSEQACDGMDVMCNPEQDEKEEPDKLVEDEELEKGNVSWKTYLFYIKTRGPAFCVTMLVSYMAFNGSDVGANFWLTKWTEDPLILNGTTDADASRDRTEYYLAYYGLFLLAQTVTISLFEFVKQYSLVLAGTNLHKIMLDRILHAPMSFFDTTPLGRIINRFSKDIDIIDRGFNIDINNFLRSFVTITSSVLVVSITTPLFMVVFFPLLLLYFAIQRFYVPISRQSRRLESVTRSPIIQGFTETIVGAQVIRAFGQTERFCEASDTAVDRNARFNFVVMTSGRWLGFRLDLIGNVIIVAAVVITVLNRSALNGAVVGLSISYAFKAAGWLQGWVHNLSNMETNAVSVERVHDYTKVDQEADWIKDDVQTSPDWPASGCVRFISYSTRYRAGLDLVLDRVTAITRGGEKIGIVGRTGAGKSSLTLSLFRLIEAAGGAIHIDGVNIADLGLHQLRRRLTILPQDPVLFTGSLRDNLDPFGDYSDSELWGVLELSHLSEWTTKQAEQLSHDVGEGGSNLSVGQRQLVCLARALLRRSKLLILDEATAAVDVATDRLVMETIRNQFQDSTILIIAHRLETILDTDRVMVLEKGQVREFDSPSNLLKKKDGIFYSLAESAGLENVSLESKR